ncbi:DUF1772 domain-containing protein [Microbacterium sp.]|uniref:anthrone oxygenase family protein n=1 Tax=Microbacterium sp. TaxID=51671 RepID=UPI003A846F28
MTTPAHTNDPSVGAVAAAPLIPSSVPNPLRTAADLASVVAAVLVAAIFGFFYAWVCSTLWGLDAADPRVAIEAMQAMNASVRNPVFFVSFFLTPVALAVAALLSWARNARIPAVLFGVAAALYTVGGILLTSTINVPWNEALAMVTVPASVDEAAAIWQEYSGKWQIANLVRTVVSGVCVVLTAIGLLQLGRARR